MSDQPEAPKPRRGIPVVLFIVSLLTVVILTGSTVWAFRLTNPGDAPTEPAVNPTTSTIDVTPTVGTAAPTTGTPNPSTVATGSGLPTMPVEPPTPATLEQPALVTHMTWSSSKGYRLTADYIQILTGDAAAEAAEEAGEESPPPNDYFIVNDSAKLRTFALPKSAKIVVLGWAGADATAKHGLTVSQFMEIMPGGADPQEQYATAFFDLTIKNGTTVTRVDQIYFP